MSSIGNCASTNSISTLNIIAMAWCKCFCYSDSGYGGRRHTHDLVARFKTSVCYGFAMKRSLVVGLGCFSCPPFFLPGSRNGEEENELVLRERET
jgi:hypothetical protein